MAGKTLYGPDYQVLDHPAEARRFLGEVALARRGEHPGFAGLSDAVANSDHLLWCYANARPQLAEIIATTWRADLESFSESSGLSPDRIRQLANQISSVAHRCAQQQSKENSMAEQAGRGVIRVNGETMFEGDRHSTGMVFNNLEGKNFLRGEHANAVAEHGEWLAYVGQKYRMTLQLGAAIELVSQDGQVLREGTIGQALVEAGLVDAPPAAVRSAAPRPTLRA